MYGCHSLSRCERPLRDAAPGDGELHEADMGGPPRSLSKEVPPTQLSTWHPSLCVLVQDKERQSQEHEEERKRLEQEAPLSENICKGLVACSRAPRTHKGQGTETEGFLILFGGGGGCGGRWGWACGVKEKAIRAIRPVIRPKLSLGSLECPLQCIFIAPKEILRRREVP